MRSLRTCIGCRTTLPKDKLFRIVKRPSGRIESDARGNLSGRGSYVCSQACFEKARTQGRFSHALKTKIADETYERIERELSEVPALRENV